MTDLGPLEPLLGNWEGNGGLDVSFHNDDGHIEETTYFEKAHFTRIPIVENGEQTMHGLNYQMTAWRHGEEDMDPFHDEVGYLLWEESTNQVLRCFAVPRGIAILAGSTVSPDAKTLHFDAVPGDPTYGLVQNKYLIAKAEATDYKSSFTLNDDGTLSYTSDLVLKLAAMNGEEMHHTDHNTLTKVS
ncbi:MAG: FABP family protein [Microthrixaceae bacterium]